MADTAPSRMEAVRRRDDPLGDLCDGKVWKAVHVVVPKSGSGSNSCDNRQKRALVGSAVHKVQGRVATTPNFDTSPLPDPVIQRYAVLVVPTDELA